ncbi:cytochrome P450 [Streptomyces montanus]|uniref:Cytochrome P450 n=1 Tax=Streptomyces montanus TaxID=2580423 RepID=A0A5R9FV38_9ACTN|nr:cytochrome P450 [Streptomyces montanus]TLS45760.1 cytochrome P450 [Streptomyces montanus]
MEHELSGLYETWRKEHGPVVPIELDGGIPAFLVIGRKELQQVCQQEDLFTPDSRQWSELQAHRVPVDWPLLPQVAYQENARFMSGAEHWRLRGVLESGLSQADSRLTRRVVEWEADRLIDRFCESGRADMVADYAAPLPLLVMLRLMGLSHEDGEQLLPAIPRLLEGGEGAQRANEQINAILQRVVAARRAQPEKDLTSWLIHSPVNRPDTDWPSLSDKEVANQAWLTILAGAGGCTNWIANVMEQVVRKTELHDLLVANRASIDQIMNVTNWENPPVQNVLGRFATRDLSLGNYQIPRGAMLVLGLAGASTDPNATGTGERISYTLTNESHPAFGAGPHGCPGERMAKDIVRTAIDHFLFRCRAPYLENPDESLDWGTSIIVRSLRILPVAFRRSDRVLGDEAASGSALGASRSAHSLFPPRMLEQLVPHASR